jgi:urea carboxylase
VGQLRAGDRIRFVPIAAEPAQQRLAVHDQQIATLRAHASTEPDVTMARATMAGTMLSGAGSRMPRNAPSPGNPSIVMRCAANERHAAICIRQSGEDNLLLEFGEPVLDLVLRFQVQALYERLHARPCTGMRELTPGIRSLQVHFDARSVSQAQVIDAVLNALSELPPVSAMRVGSRIVHLPLSWNDPATQLATQRYMQSVRADAPWCPDNIEFIRRINGLDSADDVRRIVFDASYLVMGLGDVYLGAPVATPLDPRHRLVTTKYNPARTWTPENAVGIGGAYLCVYGMEGPGGYQFVGRTVQMWNRFRQTREFAGGKPWLLRFFDQIRFFPVDADELLRMRADFPCGRYSLRVEESTLALADYQQFLRDNAASIDAFRGAQRAAFEAERTRWQAAGMAQIAPEEAAASPVAHALPPGSTAVCAPMAGNVWQLRVHAGARVAAGEELVVLEAMKMEVGVRAESAGVVREIYCARGRAVQAGEVLLSLDTED